MCIARMRTSVRHSAEVPMGPRPACHADPPPAGAFGGATQNKAAVPCGSIHWGLRWSTLLHLQAA
eukprot:4148710-Pyramimonas_sp.AAC.1